jgi:predicted SAM-dependent methyltransferase
MINNSKFLLALVAPTRQALGVRALNKIGSDIQVLVLGESHKIPNAYTTNYQVFARRFLDATKLSEVERKFKYVYADNVIEHLSIGQCRRMLSSILTVLEPGGSVRLCTPDIGRLVEFYLKRDHDFFNLIQSDLTSHSIQFEHSVDILRQAFSEFGHHRGYLFDQSSIRAELESAGFEKITFHKVSQSECRPLRGLEQRVGGSHDYTQLCVEGVKPYTF